MTRLDKSRSGLAEAWLKKKAPNQICSTWNTSNLLLLIVETSSLQVTEKFGNDESPNTGPLIEAVSMSLGGGAFYT